MKPKMTPSAAARALAKLTDQDFPTVDVDQEVDEAQAVRLVEAGRRAAGRPSLTAPGTHSPQITLRLPAQLDAGLANAAARTGRRRSELVREALDQYLARI
ncbi:MAG: ribbon-helix-helix domain-containing protein [Bifidobacteriaceae bacterium]|jgi:hypothetical protein|nr:ribbon-helix-helix domain-containing protein [Bifidobacteriaceae bacterium]